MGHDNVKYMPYIVFTRGTTSLTESQFFWYFIDFVVQQMLERDFRFCTRNLLLINLICCDKNEVSNRPTGDRKA